MVFDHLEAPDQTVAGLVVVVMKPSWMPGVSAVAEGGRDRGESVKSEHK